MLPNQHFFKKFKNQMNSIETNKHWKNMLKTEKNLEHSVIWGPPTKFLIMKLILRPAQQSEFDMPALESQTANTNNSISGPN
jgi:hypothetical protein